MLRKTSFNMGTLFFNISCRSCVALPQSPVKFLLTPSKYWPQDPHFFSSEQGTSDRRPFTKGKMKVIWPILSIFSYNLGSSWFWKQPHCLQKKRSKNEIAQAFFFSVYKAIYYTCVTQASAYDWRSQQIVVCTKIGEKLSQDIGSAEAITQLRKQAPSFSWSKIQFNVRTLVAFIYMSYSWRIQQSQNKCFSTSS